MNTFSRIIWIVTGVAWAARSIIVFSDPAYTDPESALDYTAVWLYSAALLLLAASVLLLAPLAATRGVMIAAAVVAIGAIGASVANGIEDGFGQKVFGTTYVVSFLTALVALIPLAIAFYRAGYPRLAGLTGALFLGVLLFTVGGGLIVLVAMTCIAVWPRWFARETPTTTGVAEPVSAA